MLLPYLFQRFSKMKRISRIAKDKLKVIEYVKMHRTNEISLKYGVTNRIIKKWVRLEPVAVL